MGHLSAADMRATLLARPNLLDPRFDSDSCGTGFVAAISAEPSRRVIDLGLTALARLAHRGAVAADGKSSDGVGVMTAIPRAFFLAQAEDRLAAQDTFGVGVFFFPRDCAVASEEARFAGALAAQGLRVAQWRQVPIREDLLGEEARSTLPHMRQALIVCDPQPDIAPAHMEVRLFLARQAYVRARGVGYACSLSTTKIVYKALCAGRLLPQFYPDLAEPAYRSAFLVFHQRYATNVLPSWERAQPLRMLAHNGEINTIWSNRARMAARDRSLPDVCKPILSAGGSDSTSLDEVAELLTRNGRTVAEALRMLVPPGSSRQSSFVRYHSDCVEPWDGPAALAFADGDVVGAALDRNGLRPCRFTVTTDGLVIAGSEAGLVDIDPSLVAQHGRLGPGEMMAVHLGERKLLLDRELMHRFDRSGDYGLLLADQPFEPRQPAPSAPADLTFLQAGYGFSKEDTLLVLAPMATDGKEAVWSMGDDTPIAALAHTPRPVYAWFRQRFAQVTNPAIDPLRESCVFSMHTRLGPWPHMLYRTLPLPGITLPSPLLDLAQAAALRGGDYPHAADLPIATLPCVMQANEPLEAAVRRTVEAARQAVESGAKILLLTDRDVSDDATPIPMALAVGAVDGALTINGARTEVGLAVEAGDAWDTHHIAVLIGLGAGAVCPWLALQSAERLGGVGGPRRYLDAVTAGLMKVMSKSGISAVDSYRSAHLFDLLGFAEEVRSVCFPRAAGLSGSTGWAELEQQTRARWSSRFDANDLRDLGLVRFRKNDSAEHHAWQPSTVKALQGVAGSVKNHPQPASWEPYAASVQSPRPQSVRELLQIHATSAAPLKEVEPAQQIVRRFVASAMSLGSLSPEAHQAITEGMNMLGARSNTGEGGEDPLLYRANDDGAFRRDSRIKQVASGRFGVTAEYLAHAEEIEIKISQGSKPGEGGQLPGHKVTDLIARLRHAQPGSTLISPPPHHDIYSIEDLAQLIFDLKRVNPRAAVGVKLVSSLGVGTVAAGVAKAYADFVVIAGHSGGTGASPLTSIKHAGNPWELGLAETQQVLIANGLRSRIRVRADGGLRTGRDVLVAALLGAEEFAFGTAVLVALGCDMARQCHLNTCPTGIATQREDLRAKFRGKPEHVAAFFLALAEDVRRELAACGLRSIAEAIGHTDLLSQSGEGLQLSGMLAAAATPGQRWAGGRNDRPRDPATDPATGTQPDDAWLEPALAAARDNRPYAAIAHVTNSHRAIGAQLAGEIALERAKHDAPTTAMTFHCAGTAGQSFGCFAVAGMELQLTGLANDYVGKGLSGGRLVLRHAGPIAGESHRHALLGNVALYGATSGELFAAGRAGERFAVRNSGAVAVVEGLGDHGCEYMTGGAVLVLGPTGINFGAGMTGGQAWIFDEDAGFLRNRKFADESVVVTSLADAPMETQHTVLQLLERHAELTGSRRAHVLAENWLSSVASFRRVQPASERIGPQSSQPQPQPATALEPAQA